LELPINQVDVKSIGDPFHLQSYYADRDYNDVRQLLGLDFAKAIFDPIKGGWLSPVQSGYGVHLVYISGIHKAHNERLYKNLLKKYEVVYKGVRDEVSGVR